MATASQTWRVPEIAARRGLPFDTLTLHCLLLLGYAVLGKLFAYIGFGDLYIGEIVLAIGIGAFLFSPHRWLHLKNRHVVPLLVLMMWGLIRTVPYLSDYGADALRDAVIWGYGSYALLIAALIASNPVTVSRLLDGYAWFVRIFLLLSPVVWFLSMVFGVITLVLHGHTVPILKGGDLMVHLAGVIAFLYLKIRRVSAAWLILAPVVFAVSSNTRAGILSLGVAVGLLFLLRPRGSKLALVTAVFLMALTAAVALDVRARVPGFARELSAESVITGTRSIFVETGSAKYDNTKRWRIQWWSKIADYTFRGAYFWTGKGFGPNIAFSDGMVALPADPLRSPHNGQLTFLARSGVPGFVFWLAAQGFWIWGMFARWRRCVRAGPPGLAEVFVFLMVYWTAFIINASFDVFLEGPMGGIWFWTIFGAGIGTMLVYDRTHGLSAIHGKTA